MYVLNELKYQHLKTKMKLNKKSSLSLKIIILAAILNDGHFEDFRWPLFYTSTSSVC